MSDVFEGPGWWLASNGKWYPPQNHPDERYRARYQVAEPQAPAAPAPASVPDTPSVVAPHPGTAASQLGETVETVEAVETVETVETAEASEIVETGQAAQAMRTETILDGPLFDNPGSNNTETTNLAEIHQHFAEPAHVDDATVEHTVVDVPTLDYATVEPERPGFPSVELRSEPENPARTTPLSELARSEVEPVNELAVAETAELSGVDLEIEMARVIEQREAEQRAAEQERARQEVYRALQASPDGDAPDQAPTVPIQHDRFENPEVASDDTTTTSIPTPSANASEFSVASTTFTNDPQPRPAFDEQRPLSVVEPPRRTAIGFTQVEIDQPAVDAPRSTSGPDWRAASAPVRRSSSTELVHVPEASPKVAVATTRDRLVSFGMFVSGVAMIVGSFIAWTEGALVETGWERGEGIITVVAGILGATMAGPIFVGFRHAIPKTIAITAGVIAGIALGLVAVNSVVNDPEISFGLGFVIVSVATATLIISAIVDEGEHLGY